jgi:hypothetical protein
MNISFGRVESGSQTPVFGCFVEKKPSVSNHCFKKEKIKLLNLKNKDKTEDQILNQLLKDKLKKINQKEFENPLLFDPLWKRDLFCIKKGKIFFNFNSDFQIIRKHFSFNSPKLRIFFRRLDYLFFKTISNPDNYFDKFKKLKKYFVLNNVLHSYVFFVIFLSNYLKERYLNFFLEVVLLLLIDSFNNFLTKNNSHTIDFEKFSSEFLGTIFEINQVQLKILGKKFERIYFVLLDYNKPIPLSFSEVFKIYFDYVLRNQKQ